LPPFETAPDDCLGLGHDPADQFLAGRDVVDEPGDHSTAPGTRIHVAVLQDAAVPRSMDEMANIFDRRSSTLFALDSEDFLGRRICQHPLGEAKLL